MQIDFLAIGELLADVISVDYAQDLSEAKTFEIYQGGSPANVAANLCFMGKKAALVACIGNDGIGKFLLQQLKQIGLTDKHIQISKGYATSLVLVARSRATPDFTAYRLADCQIKKIDKRVVRSTSIIHTTAFALSLQPARDVIFEALTFADENKVLLSVDWNFSPDIWGEDDGRKAFKKIMKLKPLLKISLDDLSRFVGIKSIDEYKKYLDKFSCTLICITCGKDGVWFKKQNKDWQFKETLPVAEVADTTGAGDAFWAGFITAYIDKLPLKSCVDAGLKIAAEKIQKKGPLYSSNQH